MSVIGQKYKALFVTVSVSLPVTIECCNVLSATNSGPCLSSLCLFHSDIIGVRPPMMDRMANFLSPDEINFPMLKREPVAGIYGASSEGECSRIRKLILGK